jgi:predicted DNA-binding transcriptional regulator AlpA
MSEPTPKSPFELPQTGYVRQRELLAHVLPWSSATHWRKVASGDFPAPVKLSARVTAWRVEDVRKWMAERV